MSFEKEEERLSAITDEFNEHDIREIFIELEIGEMFHMDLLKISVLSGKLEYYTERKYRLLKFVFTNIKLIIDISRFILQFQVNDPVWDLFTDCERLSIRIKHDPYLTEKLYQLKFTSLDTSIINDDIMRLNFKILNIPRSVSLEGLSQESRNKIRLMVPPRKLSSEMPNYILTNTDKSHINIFPFINKIDFNEDSPFYEQYPDGPYDVTVEWLDEIIEHHNRIVRVKRAN